MITHQEIKTHFNDAGFRVGLNPKTKRETWLAISDERGVKFTWNICDSKRGFQGTCGQMPHIHIAHLVRYSAGKPFSPWSQHEWSVPVCFEEIDQHRGAPSERFKMTKKKLPKPFGFKESRFVKDGDRYRRAVTIVKAVLLGPVGIQENAKICSDMAAVPDEPVWWHFSCDGATTATFNVITDGEVWHPVNRRSHKITTQLKPKKSVDLTFMSVEDRDFMTHIIRDYITTL